MKPWKLDVYRTKRSIPGFRTPFHRAMSFLYLLQQRLRMQPHGKLDEARNRTNVIGFLWPSHKTSYAGARAKVPGSAMRLRALLQTLRSRGCTVTVVGHSLGARVALSAVKDAHPDDLVANMLLIGAAVLHDALSDTGDFPRASLAVRRITAFYSKNDAVLAGGFSFAEVTAGCGFKSDAAMGFRGMSEPLPPDCSCVDVSSAVPSHNADDYILAPQIISAIITAVDEKAGEASDTCEQVEAFLSSVRLLRGGSLDEAEGAGSLSDEDSGAEVACP